MHSYFQPRRWERNGDFYARFGVRKARPFVSGGTFWQRFGLASRRPSWHRSNVSGYVTQSIYAEVAHTASLIFLLIVATLFFLKGGFGEASAVTALNFIINLVPIAVVRYNRLRILRHRSHRNMHYGGS